MMTMINSKNESNKNIEIEKKVEIVRRGKGWVFKCGNREYGGDKGIYDPHDVYVSDVAIALDVDPKLVSEALRKFERIQKYFVNGKFIPKLLAEEILKEYRFVTMMDNEIIYVYGDDGFYQPVGEVLIKKLCKQKLEEEYRKSRVSEVIDYIKASTYAKRHEEPPNLIPLENGVLDIETMELRPHSPDYMFFNKLPVKYDPQADCPRIKKFLREITSSEEDVLILEELIGFCLYRDYFISKALMLVGGGSNGKSTFLNLVKAFLGFENVSSRSLQDLEENRFAKADLYHKLANIYADISDKALYRTGTFKMLTGRDPITAERKFHNSFQFENYAKLLFSANKVPEAYDDTDAFFRRWIIIVFPNQFMGNMADPNILESLTTEEELSGLLNRALEGLKRLLRNGQFSHSKTTEEIREDYIRKSSPIAAFVMDCLENDSDSFIVKKELYSTFAEYCRVRAIPSVTQDTFFKNLPRHVPVADYRPRVGGERFHTFKGIRYSSGVSSLSSVSRVFYTLIQKMDEFSNDSYKVEELPEEGLLKVTIKIGKTLDMLDTLDQSEKLPPSTLDYFNSSNIDSVGWEKRVVFESNKRRVCDFITYNPGLSREEILECLDPERETETELNKVLDALVLESKVVERAGKYYLGGSLKDPEAKHPAAIGQDLRNEGG